MIREMPKIRAVGGRCDGREVLGIGPTVWIKTDETAEPELYHLHRAHLLDGSNRKYYVNDGVRLEDVLDAHTLDWIEVCG